MTPHEFTDLVDYLTTRWNPGRIWGSDDRLASLFYDFQKFDTPTVMRAARDLYHEGGKNIPTPSQLMEKVRGLIEDSGLTEPPAPCEETPIGHRWAMYEKDQKTGRWLVQCVRCGRGPEYREGVATVGTIAELQESVTDSQ